MIENNMKVGEDDDKEEDEEKSLLLHAALDAAAEDSTKLAENPEDPS